MWTTSGREAAYRAKMALEQDDPYYNYLIDWQMPETSGIETARRIRSVVGQDAPIIILDEATASIDPENEHLIQAALSELTRGKTIITIAHRLATIQNADQILVVDDGRIVQRGTHRELAAQPGRYRSFVETRQRAEGWNIA